MIVNISKELAQNGLGRGWVVGEFVAGWRPRPAFALLEELAQNGLGRGWVVGEFVAG
jgi:hypothetical protein